VRRVLAGALISGLAFGFVGGELELGVWSQDPKGYVQYPADEGTPLSVDDDLKLGDETRFTGKLKLELPAFFPNLYLGYTRMEFSGSNFVQNVRFGDYVFNADINTNVKADQYDVGFYYHVPVIKSSLLDPEVGLVVKVVDFETTVSGKGYPVNNPAVSGSFSETVSKTVPLPLIYLHLGVYPLPLVGVVGEFKGLKVSDDYFYGYKVGLRLLPVSVGVGRFFAEAGYRYQRLRLKDVSNTNADVRVGGFYGSVGLSF